MFQMCVCVRESRVVIVAKTSNVEALSYPQALDCECEPSVNDTGDGPLEYRWRGEAIWEWEAVKAAGSGSLG